MEGQLKNGTILTSESGNKYTVVNLLGAGGQGEVYDVCLLYTSPSPRDS